MSLILQDIQDHIVSHAQTTGYFDQVNQHEPKNAPGSGIVCSVFLAGIKPAKSGLDSVSVTVTFNIRIQTNMLSDPLDSQEAKLSDAASALWVNLAGDCTLDETTRCVDLFGIEGQALAMQCGYAEQDKRMFRVFDLMVPVIVNDVFQITQ